MGKTAKYNLPFPNPTDKANIAQDIQNLAEAAETALENKVNSEIGKRLITEAEAEKLASLKNYDDSKLQEIIDNQAIKIEELEEELETLYGDFEPAKASGEIATINDGVDKSRVEVQGDGNSYQETSEASKNICPDKIEYWESGDYSTQNGEKTDNTSRIRLKELLKVTPSEEHYFNHHFVTTDTVQLNFVLRGYDKDKQYIENIGAVSNNSSKLMSENVEYIGVGLYNIKNINNEVFETYKEIFESGAVKPFICLNSETDKSYVPYSINKPSTEFPSDIEVIDMVNKLPYPYVDTTKTENGITFTDNGDGTVTANGTATANASFTLYGTQGEQKEIPKGFISGGINTNVRVRVLNKNSDGYATLGSSNGTDTKIDLSTYTKGYVEIMIASGTTVNNVVIKPMIAETSGKPYLPYGHIGLLQSGKNRIDKSKITYNYYYNSTGGLAYSSNWGYIDVKVKPSTSYFVSGKSVENRSAYFVLLDKNKKFIKYLGYYADVNLINTTENTGYIGMSIPNYADQSDVDTIMLEENKVATEYEEYKENLIPIDLQGNTLAKVGDIKDLLNIGLDGSVSIEKKSFNEKITSSNVLAKNTYGINCYALSKSYDHNRDVYAINILSNYFKGIIYDKRTEELSNSIYTELNSERFTIRNIPFTTVEEFKTFLDNNDVYIMYVLAKSNTIQLPSISPIKLFEGTNNFELVTNLDTTLEVSYKESNKKRLNALENAILSIGGISNV